MDFINKIIQNGDQQARQMPKYLADLVIINSPIIINAVKRRWLLGESVNGGKIGEYRNAEYRAFKISQNPRAGGYVDLYFSGDLVEGLTLKHDSQSRIEIFSVDEKFSKISKKYGLKEFNITPAEWYEIGNEILTLAYQKQLEQMYG